MKPKKLIAVLAAATFSVSAMLFGPTTGTATAQAFTEEAQPCNFGRFGPQICFWYSPNFRNANASVYRYAYPDLLNPPIRFAQGPPYPQVGGLQPVGNNSASVANYHADRNAYVYYSKNLTGIFIRVPPLKGISDMGPLRNNNRSYAMA